MKLQVVTNSTSNGSLQDAFWKNYSVFGVVHYAVLITFILCSVQKPVRHILVRRSPRKECPMYNCDGAIVMIDLIPTLLPWAAADRTRYMVDSWRLERSKGGFRLVSRIIRPAWNLMKFASKLKPKNLIGTFYKESATYTSKTTNIEFVSTRKDSSMVLSVIHCCTDSSDAEYSW